MLNDDTSKYIQSFIEADSFLSSLNLKVEEIITARRGSIVARLQDAYQDYAFKLAYSNNEGQYNQYLLIQRESSTLEALAAIADNLHIAHGHSESSAWLLMRWFGKNTASKTARKLRENSINIEAFLSLFLLLVEKIENIHSSGYLHGDIQPDHFLITDKKVVLIDWGLSHKNGDRDFHFKGSFIHFAAPEVANGMLHKNADIPYNSLSESYSLAASLFFLYTGRTAINYGTYEYKSISFEEKLGCILRGQFNTFKNIGIEPFPELERLLKKGLNLEESQRITVTEIKNGLLEII